jgi:hypothetical protein
MGMGGKSRCGEDTSTSMEKFIISQAGPFHICLSCYGIDVTTDAGSDMMIIWTCPYF